MTVQDRYTLAYRTWPYARVADQDSDQPVRHPVVVAGGGPVGMALALDLALKGVRVLVLDDHEGIGMGSRAICFAKRPLEILDRLGCAAPMVGKGVVWNLGKVFHHDDLIYEFNLLPEGGHKFPAFINLQQPYMEKFLVDHVAALQAQGLPLEIRGKNRVDAVEQHADHAVLTVMTPDGPYKLAADWLVACDGASSPIRTMLGLGFEGEVFKDSFLIADVRMKAKFPTERWFWFDPPSGAGASQLLHKQPDDVWRIDFQIGWDVDRKEELKEENVRRRVADMIGHDVEFEVVWSSIYTFQCRRMTDFHAGRVIFAGDAAHQVSPFGARGANSGLQDSDNLAWKLKLILDGKATPKLLESYDIERIHGANENILNSTRATDFITPKTEVSRTFRDAVLHLAEKHDFARPFVNSGRLSVPCTYDGSPLNTPDALPGGPAQSCPGSPCPDAPLDGGFLMEKLGDRTGARFQVLAIDTDAPETFSAFGLDCAVLRLSTDGNDALRARYLGVAAGAIYLIRPDQHVAARWPNWDEGAARAALARACALEDTTDAGLPRGETSADHAALGGRVDIPIASPRDDMVNKVLFPRGETDQPGQSAHGEMINEVRIPRGETHPGGQSPRGETNQSGQFPRGETGAARPDGAKASGGGLNTTRNTPRPDDVYARLIKAHEGRTRDESDALNARLILTLINHIGDEAVIAEALKLAEG